MIGCRGFLEARLHATPKIVRRGKGLSPSAPKTHYRCLTGPQQTAIDYPNKLIALSPQFNSILPELPKGKEIRTSEVQKADNLATLWRNFGNNAPLQDKLLPVFPTAAEAKATKIDASR